MNYLAHAFLAGPDESHRLGGLLGDFVKGPLPGSLPPEIAAGVALHRRIDSYADTHPAFVRSRQRVSDARRRYAGIMVDMFYDHLLAAEWNTFSPQPLTDYTAEVYALLDHHAPLLPARLAEILPYMRRDDWLAGYRTTDGVGNALDRMARHRLSRPGTLPGAVAELLADYVGFRSDFHDFMQDCQGFVDLQKMQLAAEFSGANPA